MDENQVNTQENASKSSPMIIVVLLAIVALIAGVVVMKKNNTVKQEVETQKVMPITKTVSPSEATKTASDSSMSDTAVKTMDVEAGSFYYKPAMMTMKKGEKLKIVLHAVSMMHDFNIDELNVHMPIVKNGETGTVEFTADKAGEFEYYCSVGQHRSLGQVGKLTVTE